MTAIALLAACGDPIDPGQRQPPTGTAPILIRAAVDPLVTRVGESARLLLTVEGADGDSVRLQLPGVASLLEDGAPVSMLTLRDDGTGGDDHAGDGTFTVDGLTARLTNQVVGSTTIGTATLFAQAGDASLSAFVRPRVSVRTADQNRLAVPEITVLPDRDMQVTSRVVVLVTQVDPVDFADARDSIIARYYDVFPDDRDWLVVTRAPSAAEEFEGQALRIQNGISGLGMRLFHASRSFGSAARLELVTELVRDFYRPQGEFDGAFCLVTHEITHRWAAELGAPLAASSHWTDAFLRTASGLGWDGVCRFNPLELYLAGRLPPDSVPGALTAQGMTVADVVARHGPRVPATGPEVYTVGFVFVTDRFLTDHELAYFHYLAEEYTRPESPLGLTFEGATGGRISLDGALPPPRR